jgi:hypothetical protein
MMILLPALVQATTAEAFARPALRLTPRSNQVTAGATLVLNYSSQGLPMGSRLYFQKQVGTAAIWQNVAALHSRAGIATAPGRPLGVYKYRVVVINRHRLLATSATVVVYSYGTVTLSTLCRTLNTPCSSGTEPVGTTLLEYEEGPNAPGFTYPNFGETLKVERSTCRSGQVRFAFYKPPKTGQAYMKLLQARAEPQEVSIASPNEVGTFAFTFAGGAWELLNASSTGGNLVISGIFSCYTATGQ